MTQPTRVLLIGYGEMGHAMEHLLAPNHDVRIWTRAGVRGEESLSLEGAAADSDFVVFCVPASPIAQLAERIQPALAVGTLCLSMAKGLDDRGRTAAGAFTAVFGSRGSFGLLYGPMIAEELLADRPGFADVGIVDRLGYERIAALFAGTALYLEHATDLAGISWAAVLKNVYVILFGAADELGLGDNVRGYLAAAVMDEMETAVTALGGTGTRLCTFAGLGDLITTATSAGSHHRELGRRLARGERDANHGEGLHTLATLARLDLIAIENYPLLRLVQNIAADPACAGRRLRAHLERSRS
jgi:glycerol-3-phosphate dehydrogenase (NAD(P)+)